MLADFCLRTSDMFEGLLFKTFKIERYFKLAQRAQHPLASTSYPCYRTISLVPLYIFL